MRWTAEVVSGLVLGVMSTVGEGASSPAPMRAPPPDRDTVTPPSDMNDADRDAGAFAVADLASPDGGRARGLVRLVSVMDATGEGSAILITVRVADVTPGAHAFVLHERGDCADPGPHWNPGHARHGAPTSGRRHLGDFGNVKVAPNGTGEITLRVAFTTDVRGDTRGVLVGRVVALHERADDFVTQPDGDAGRIVACGVLEHAESIAH